MSQLPRSYDGRRRHYDGHRMELPPLRDPSEAELTAIEAEEVDTLWFIGLQRLQDSGDSCAHLGGLLGVAGDEVRREEIPIAGV